MDIFQVLLNISRFKRNETIYAVEPWTPESEAQVVLEPAEGLIHIIRGDLRFEYFLEVSLAQDLLQQNQHSSLCMRDQCLRMIEYAMQNT